MPLPRPCVPTRGLCPPTSVSQCIAAQFTRGNSKFILLVELAKSNSPAKETLGAYGTKSVARSTVKMNVVFPSQLSGVYMLIMWVVYKNNNKHHLKRLLYIFD